ncbi:hypothetical protein GS504_03260 [Rhodococcus hoagii]|nr:hypothetical protein [Prescottella equi]
MNYTSTEADTASRQDAVGQNPRRFRWATVQPAVRFAASLTAITLFLGFYRFADLTQMRQAMVEDADRWNTYLAVIDAAESVTDAATAVGSSGVVIGNGLWLAFVGVAALWIHTAAVWMIQRLDPGAPYTPALRNTLHSIVLVIVKVMVACGIVAWAAGEPTVLLSVSFWVYVAVIAGLLWLSAQVERVAVSKVPSPSVIPVGVRVGKTDLLSVVKGGDQR